MVKLDKIYTRGGDAGETSLVGGARVSKHSLRPSAFGGVDEVNATIGLCRLHAQTLKDMKIDVMLGRIQNDLFDLGADLATPPSDTTNDLRVTAAQVDRLETEIDVMNATLKPLNSFILPGGCAAAAYIHHARTQTRRAERAMTALKAIEVVGSPAMQYINRLSDHLFVMARYVNHQHGGDILWKPGLNA